MDRAIGNEYAKQTTQCRNPVSASSAVRASDSDQRLVARAKDGDKQAFNDLFERYHSRLSRLLFRVIRNPTDVEDLAQDVFIKAYMGLPGFRGDSAFYSWLYRIGINVAKNHLSGAKRHAPMIGSVDIEDAEVFEDAAQLRDHDTPLDILRTCEVAEAIERATDDLSPELRVALEMCEIKSMSYGEIARCMHCPIGTVRSRIFRAREAIADHVRPMLDVETERIW